MPADCFHGTCCPIQRAYQKTLAVVNLQIYFRDFSSLTSTLCLSFLHLNFTITNYFFFKRWQACKSSGLTSCLVKENALQMFSSSSSLLIDEGTGFTSTDFCWWYWALVTAFFSNWITLSESFDGMSSTEMSSSVCSSFERFSYWRLVPIILIEDDDRI